MAGLILAGASAISHDLCARVFGMTNERQELRASRLATVGIGVAAVLLGLAFASAASANFPVLVLAMAWRGLTTAGRWRAASPGWCRRSR